MKCSHEVTSWQLFIRRGPKLRFFPKQIFLIYQYMIKKGGGVVTVFCPTEEHGHGIYLNRQRGGGISRGERENFEDGFFSGF